MPTGGWTDAGSFTVTDDGGAHNITIDAGTYYWSSVGNNVEDFAAQLAEDINQAATGSGTFTVSISAAEGGTGKVTIAISSGTFSLAWGTGDGLTVRNLCGFAANISAGASSTGANHALGLWLPDCPVDTPYGLTSDGLLTYDAIATYAPDGTYKAVSYSSVTNNEYTYQAVSKNKTITAGETSTNESYETFWDDCIAGQASWAEGGKALRWYADASTDGTYKTVCVTNITSPEYYRTVPEWDGQWRIRIPVIKNV